MPEPQFKKYKDASIAVRTQSYMTHPVFTADGELCCCIQIMAKEKKNAKTKNKLYSGFTNIDEIFLGILSAFVQAKVQQILA